MSSRPHSTPLVDAPRQDRKDTSIRTHGALVGDRLSSDTLCDGFMIRRHERKALKTPHIWGYEDHERRMRCDLNVMISGSTRVEVRKENTCLVLLN